MQLRNKVRINFATNLMLVLSCLAFSQSCKKRKIEASGDVIIFGMFPVQYCEKEKIDDTAVIWAEAMRYTINQANSHMKKISFGYTIYDSDNYAVLEGTTDATIDILLNLDTQYLIYNQYYVCLVNNSILNKVLGLVGPTDSTNSINVHQLTSFIEISLVSYSATSFELSNKELYPNFFRTMPTDEFEVMFITDLLIHFNWTYVSIIASDSSYGRNGAFLLQDMFSNNGICVSAYISLGDDYDQNEYANALVKVAAQSKVVIFWGFIDSAKNLLNDCRYLNLTDVNWILSESSTLQDWLIEFKKNYAGQIMMVLLSSHGVDDFRNFLLNSTYENSSEWLRALFEKYSVNRTYHDVKLGDITQSLDFSWVSYIQTAVSVFINSYLKYQECQHSLSSCNPVLIKNRRDFNNVIKNISFHTFENNSFRFNNNQDPMTAHYDLYIATNLTTLYIGSWSSEMRFEKIDDSILNTISSKCAEPCPPGHFAVIDLQQTCCWICVFCAENYVKNQKGSGECEKCKLDEDYYSNANRTECIKLKRILWSFRQKEQLLRLVIGLSFSLLGGVITIIFMLVFFVKRNTPIVRSSNFRLSLGQMGVHLILFAVPILTLEEDSQLKCLSRTYIGGLLYFAIITLTSIKVTHLITVFGAFRKLSKKDMMRIRFKEGLLFFCAILIYVTMILVVQTMYPLIIIEEVNVNALTVYKYCNTGTFFFFHIGCVFILLIFCAIQTFRGRKLPWKFNEAKYVAFGMFSSCIVQMISIPIGLSLQDPVSNNLLLCLASNLSNLLLFVILFGFKVKIILFDPEQNTIKRFRKTTLKGVLESNTRQTSSRNVEKPDLNLSETNGL